MATHNAEPGNATIANPILINVRRVIEREELTLNEAAKLIGVTAGSLKRHLSGQYVRSDSIARYRAWLDGHARVGKRVQLSLADMKASRRVRTNGPDLLTERVLCQERPTRFRPYFVVDLFSGCGGMSLGFDAFEEGKVFQTVMALDIDDAMVRAFNRNAMHSTSLAGRVCRRVDLSQFLNETEVLAFYLDHLNKSGLTPDLSLKLENLPVMGLQEFKRQISVLDQTFLGRLLRIRSTPAFRREFSNLMVNALGQTSVVGFHDSLCLPLTSGGAPSLGPLIWHEGETNDKVHAEHHTDDRPFVMERAISNELAQSWENEVDKLRVKANGTAQGQLASSAGRVAAFLRFLETPPMREIRREWLAWRSERDSLRLEMFKNKETSRALNSSYTDDLRVDVLLGGPPCQGFSRMGRGKIRSLRESGVHVQSDSEAGDHRNLLLYKYVLFVGALRPRVFLFENVRHFQAQVKTPDGVFQATQVLAEAIQGISRDELKYCVSSGTIDASAHLIPQTRERFFMCGIRSDEMPAETLFDIPKWCLSLSHHGDVPLRAALQGLPEPHWVGLQGNGADLSRRVQTTLEHRSSTGPENLFTNWLVQARRTGREDCLTRTTDSHHARLPRSDDRDLFQMMGPGKRWMDYRCDRSETLAELRHLLQVVRRAMPRRAKERSSRKNGHEIDINRVERLMKKLDGSLSLRLMLECIEPRPGELHHHLITESYLAKREGNHGDWLARLSPNVPCKTIMSHMAKDTYAYVHPYEPRMLSVREAARIQSFPDWFSFAGLGFVDALRAIGNAVPPLLSHQFAQKIVQVLWASDSETRSREHQVVHTEMEVHRDVLA